MNRKSTTNLSSVIEINPASISPNYPYDEIEYIDISSVGTGFLSGSTHMPLVEAPSRAKRLVENGDTILATVRPNLRSFLYIKNPPENMVVSTGFAVLHPRNKIDARFLYYTVTNQRFTDYLSANVKGAAYPAVDAETFARAEIWLPDLQVQHRIAAILSAYDDLIENNLRRIKILEEMAQTLYREWFVKFRFPAYAEASAGKPGHQKVKMVDSPLGKIPEGWEVKPLADLVDTQYGYTESAQERPVGPKFLRGTDINKNPYINWSTVPYCSINKEEYPKFRLDREDIVVIRMADPGKVAIVEVDIDAVFASYLVRLKISDKSITPYYLFHFLLSDTYQGYISGASTGTTRKSASAGVIVGIDILVPPKPILEKFQSVVVSLRKMLNNLLAKNAVLRQTRDLLLPKLISGELDVSELDIKIPEGNA